MQLPAGTVEVKLTEVVRSTQRIVAAAMQFQATGDKLTRSHCDYPGPPLKAFIFQEEPSAKTLGLYVLAAIEYLVEMMPSLSLHNRLAILVRDESTRAALASTLTELVEKSAKLKSQNKMFKFVDAATASAIPSFGRSTQHHTEEMIVLDAINQFDGHERLFVIAVGLDQPVSASKSCSQVSARVQCTA